MTAHASTVREGPWLQAARMAFVALYGMTLVAAMAWATSNVRQIGPEHRALVLRLGAMNRIQNAGLLLAWPQPFEQVVLVPSTERVLDRHVDALLRSDEAKLADIGVAVASDALAGSGYLLTGDAGVVQMDARVFYKVTDPYAYVLQGEHVAAALDRVVTRAAVAVCASRDLDHILVARPELMGGDSHSAELRERLRGDVVQGINQGLTALAHEGTPLGIHVERVDLQSSLPRDAVNAFNSVLTASQLAEKNIAGARNDAAKQTQAATQAVDYTLQVAHAQANERLAKARADTATIAALAAAPGAGDSQSLMLRLYRERMPAVLSKAGSVITVDPRDDARLILQGMAP